MGESNAVERRQSGRAHNGPRAREERSVAIESFVTERPWTAVGTATGVGLVLGTQTRRLAESRVFGMILATLGGVAMRLATSALVQWLERPRKR